MVAFSGIPRQPPGKTCDMVMELVGAQLSSQKRADLPFSTLILIKGDPLSTTSLNQAAHTESSLKKIIQISRIEQALFHT